MNDLKSGINNLVKETEQNNQPSNLEQSKQYLTNKCYDLNALGKDNGFSNEFKRLNINDFDDEHLQHLNNYGKYLQSQKENAIFEKEKSLPPIDFEKMFDSSVSGGRGSFKRAFNRELDQRPSFKEFNYGNRTYKLTNDKDWRDNRLFDAYENGNLVEKGIDPTEYIRGDIHGKRYNALNTDELINKAKSEIGLTNKFRVATYMLPDGTLLDGSGGTGYSRGEDHRYISQIYPQLDYEYASDYMDDFMKRGAIRLMPENNSVELMSKPSQNQINQIMRYARQGYITSIETPDGDYYEDINPAQLNAILLSIK